MATFAVVDIEKGFENQGRICKCVEEALWELGLRDKLEEVLIKHTPSGSSTDMNYLSPKKSLVLEIVDSLENLEGRVLHELMHVTDQLNKKFKYKKGREPEGGTGERRRYKYLWNVYIDSRLERAGRPAYETRQTREGEMRECYPELSADMRTQVFDFLWELEPLDQKQIAKMSHDLFSASKELKSLAHSRGERLHKFKTQEDLENYRR
ncbi:MAG: hypothetical protein A3C38_07475 [Planctomycetes bacterium RIFCSPHIGHO2_02_FULL_50_42]|nr:MAG: hypothetical protein A2060_07000 [Planctomycetes bacterium GWA2_50_13]OHB90107.1 MAG: hypothetical protein A3C38_07475 [Planctomycetes bacterium RIFCSPHIGHO2_02_FULL_50_42]OHB92717.1 MAG: hypothetical protein A3E75_02290 [Planctomycetes bacterium RIFCSPHIGHO2_12_FULL_51_37]OHB96384.1 MAG: hypothetical protein A3I59_10095 [Planctomycetes bacterium RIFCSPLOWO2_02_FULL_50_16]OHC05138.1 MAG: hypothetical protein A3G17_00875 [Planctomycetes bacterium RIFCSPLOWO2_12_FULL_50_35]HCN19655.1 hyp